MNRYSFEKIVKRMADQYGRIEHGHEDPYNPMFFVMESNALKVHRHNPKANSRSFREALLLGLHTVNMRINGIDLTGIQDALAPFETPENMELLHALLFTFDPYSNEELAEYIKKDAATHAGVDEIDDYPLDYLRKYYTIPIQCMIRLVESVDTWVKALGSDGYFKSIEGTIGQKVKKNDFVLNTYALLLHKPVVDEAHQLVVDESAGPLAYFVLCMLQVWEVPNENEEIVASTFVEMWPAVRDELKSMGVHTLEKVVVDSFDGDLSVDFFNIIQTMDMYLHNTGRDRELISYCDDLLEIFPEDSNITRFRGIKGEAIHDDGRKDEAYRYFDDLMEIYRDEETVGAYTMILLLDKEYAKAREVLRGFEDSKDDLIRERFDWLKEEAPEVM